MKKLTANQMAVVLGGDIQPLSEPPGWDPAQAAYEQMIEDIMNQLWLQDLFAQLGMAAAQ